MYRTTEETLNELASKIRSKRLLIDDLSPDTVMEMIESGNFGVNEKDNGGNTPMYYFSFLGRNDLVEKIIEMGADPNEGILVYNSINTDVIETLIEAGADVNAKDKNGKTPLFYLIDSINIEGIKALIQAGADVNARDNEGRFPLLYATQNIYKYKPSILTIRYDKSEIYKSFDILKILAEAGADVNARYENGKTLLFYMIDNDCVAGVKLLVEELNADVNIKDNEGYSPLLYAANKNRKDVNFYIFKTLVVNGANIFEKDPSGKDLFIIAFEKWDTWIIDLLLIERILKDDYKIEQRKRVIKSEDPYIDFLEFTIFVRDSKGDVVYEKTFYSKRGWFPDGRYLDYIKPTKTTLNEYEQITILYLLKGVTSEYMVKEFARSEIGYILDMLKNKTKDEIRTTYKRRRTRDEIDKIRDIIEARNRIKIVLEKLERGDSDSIEIIDMGTKTFRKTKADGYVRYTSLGTEILDNNDNKTSDNVKIDIKKKNNENSRDIK